MTSPCATAAVIVNYRTAQATIGAVQSLAAVAPWVSTVVVDNASGDGSLAVLRGALPYAVVVETGVNLGFSGGCNVGIRRVLESGADRVLLLNSDAIVPEGMVETLERSLEFEERIGIVGPLVVDLEDPVRIQSAGIRYVRLTGRMRHHGYRSRRSGRTSERRIVDGVSGCAMLVNRAVFDAIGFLSEEFFFGFEDLDFCLRARAAGFGTACIGRTFVRHQGNLSIGRTSAQRLYYGARNHLLIAARHGYQHAPARWLSSLAVVGLNLAHAIRRGEVSRRQGIEAVVAGTRDYALNRFGPAPTIAPETNTEGSQ